MEDDNISTQGEIQKVLGARDSCRVLPAVDDAGDSQAYVRVGFCGYRSRARLVQGARQAEDSCQDAYPLLTFRRQRRKRAARRIGFGTAVIPHGQREDIPVFRPPTDRRGKVPHGFGCRLLR